jgi:hypothetical protein
MSAFRQAFPKDRISVTFDTAYRSSGTVSMPIFTLNESLKRIGKIVVDKIVFPCSYFIFHSGNNSLGTINATEIIIPAATYTASTLAAAVQTAIRATGGGFSSATCSYNNITKLFTISSGSASTFNISALASLSPILGFTSNSNSITSVSSNFAIYEDNFVIVANNRSFVINQSATDYTFNIPVGNYSGNSLANELQTQILLQLSNFTVSYNSNNYTFVITANSSFTFKSTGTASSLLGFNTNVSSTSNIVVSPNPANIIGPTSVIIKSRTITNARQTYVRCNSIYIDNIYELLLNGDMGDIIYDNPDENNDIFIASSSGTSFTTIDFRICDDEGRIIDLGVNGRWKIILIFETY